MAHDAITGAGDALNEARLTEAIASAIAAEAGRAGRQLAFMEVCGTHTVSIARSGLRQFLPSSIKLLSGPGCPVCVTSASDIDMAISLAGLPGVTVASFGDMLRVPGPRGSLESARAAGGSVEIVYSPLDALDIARRDPARKVVFIAVGFETTAPAIAATVLEAAGSGVKNFFILPLLKTVPPALSALLADPQCAVDGFLLPGHVSAVIGVKPYEDVLSSAGKPGVIAGFEAADILHGIRRLAALCADKRFAVENAYARVVQNAGNKVAQEIMARVFEPCDAIWRGLGPIPASGLRLGKEFSGFDAAAAFGLSAQPVAEPAGCLCGRVLPGKAAPADCGLFGTACTPSSPVGPCMVSSEGSCAAAYQYRP